jgi:formamidopyrimidine-DNA glycosylase
MPELPEVEFARRCWERWAKGRTVTAVTAEAGRVLRPATPRALQVLRGARFEGFDRRGKNLMVTARRAGKAIGLWSHLGMTGKWLRRAQGTEPPRFARASFALDDDQVLYYCDMRLFGRLQVVPGARWAEVAEIAALGPDPLVDGIDVQRLVERLARVRVPIKVALLDQALLAGVGNIQASEALFRAGIDPRRPARELSPAEVRRVASGVEKSIAATLAGFQRAGGDIAYVEEPGTANPFAVYDREGERCPGGKGGVIQRIVQAGRSTFFCPKCQK